MANWTLLLAQTAAGKPERLPADVIPWLIALLVLIAIGGLAIFMVRRYTRGSGAEAGGFTLQDLRNLHARGELSDEEYARARQQMIGRVKRATEPNRPAGDTPLTGNQPPRQID